MKDKKVSVVIPVYNQENYLDISIPSVLKQSYTDIEIVIVNDGSTDKGADIIEKYRRLDSRVKVVTKENGGLVDATLAGFDASSGEYICFVDPDDTVGVDFVQNFIDHLEDDIDVVAAGIYFQTGDKVLPYYLKENRVFVQDEFQYLIETLYIEKGVFGTPNHIFVSRCNKIYKRECIAQIKEDFCSCKNVSVGEDSIFTYLLLHKCHKIKTIREANSYYYNISNSLSMMNNATVQTYLEKVQNAYDVIKSFLILNNEDVTRANILYGLLVMDFLKKNRSDFNAGFVYIFTALKKDKLFLKSLITIFPYLTSRREKIDFLLLRYVNSAGVYYKIIKKLYK